MNNYRYLSQKSLNTVRKCLLERGDGLSTSICIPSSRFDHNVKSKSHLNKIIKRKRFNNQKYYSKPISIINWFYEFIKHIFTAYDESPLHDDTTRSCSTCQFEHVHARINTIQSKLKLSKSHSALRPKTNSKLMVTAATSSSNLNISPSIILRSSKSTQTEANQSTIYPLYCFPNKHSQILSPTVIPVVKEIISSSSSSSLCINKEKLKSCNSTINSIVRSLRTTDIYSYSSYQPTIASSHSNTISLQTTQNFDRPSSSLYDTRTCHFGKRNCLIECYHSSQTEEDYRSNHHYSSSTNTNAPEIVFAESTCQLIQQAWLSSAPDQQASFES